MNKEGHYEDEYSEMWIEDGIGFQVYKREAKITLEIAKHMVRKRIETFNGIARPVFVDVTNLLEADTDARKYFASKEASQLITAGAVYFKNPISAWMVNVFFLVNEPITTSKAFHDKQKALKWLQQFKYMN